MPPDKLAFLKESASFRKGNEASLPEGELELYDDCVVLRISHRLALSDLVRPLPPTFPGVNMVESIPFSRVTRINGVMKKGFLSRSVKIEMQTNEGVTWSIGGSVRILDALQKAYLSWKNSGHE